MAENQLRASEIVGQLPRTLQNRFHSLGGYVRAIVEEEEERLGYQARIDDDDLQFIQLAALLYTLDDFFRAGSAAARAASTTFSSLKMRGFSVGRTEFTSNNAATRMGDDLANGLRQVLSDTTLGRHIRMAQSMTKLVQALVKEVHDG